MKKVDPVAWAAAHREAHDVAERNGGRLSNRDARRLGGRCGITARAFRRRLQRLREHRPPAGRRRFRLGAEHLALIAYRGSVKAAAAEAKARGIDDHSHWTWLRSYRTDLSAAERAGLRSGETAMRARQVYVRFEADEINDLWQLDTHEPAIDTLELRAWLALPAEERARTPRPDFWVFLPIDDRSRLLAGARWGLVHPNAGDVTGCLADGVETYGAPRGVLWDNALEQIGAAPTEAMERMGIDDPRATGPYMPFQKGKIERVNRTMDDEFFSLQPGWRGGADSPVTLRFGGRHPDEGDPLPAAVLGARFLQWVASYNTSRPHSALGGLTPFAFRARETFELRMPSAEALALARLATAVERTVGKDGIDFDGRRYNHWRLNAVGREPVRVAPHAADPDRLYVLRGDAFLCVAKEESALTQKERLAIVSSREAQVQRVRAAEAGAARLRAGREIGERRASSARPLADLGEDLLLGLLDKDGPDAA